LDDSNPDPALAELVAVLRDARAMLASEGNNFACSSWWKSAADALNEVDRLIAALESGEHPRRLDLEVLFAPTGPIQEVSASRGWGAPFLALARRFNAALPRAYTK
jgi:hypothetical protein